MSKESVLKKQFQKKDVERLRNLMQGKYGDKSGTSVGFKKAKDYYNEGDIWEADGRTWTIKNGIKQNVTKLDKAKKAHVVPLLCPKCKKAMKRVDKRIDEFKQYVKERLQENNKSFVSENGEIEKWIGKLDESKVEEYLNSVISYLETLKVKST